MSRENFLIILAFSTPSSKIGNCRPNLPFYIIYYSLFVLVVLEELLCQRLFSSEFDIIFRDCSE